MWMTRGCLVVVAALGIVLDESVLPLEALRNPNSLLNPQHVGRMAQNLNEQAVGTYDIVATDAARVIGILRRRIANSVDATFDAKEDILDRAAGTDKHPKRIVNTLLGVGEPFHLPFANTVSDIAGNTINVAYRTAFGPLASTLRLKRAIMVPTIGKTEDAECAEDAPQDNDADDVDTLTIAADPTDAPPTGAPLANAPSADAPSADAPLAAAPLTGTDPLAAGYPGGPFNIYPSSFLPAITIPVYINPQMPSDEAALAGTEPPTDAPANPCTGEIEQTTKVYVDDEGHLQMEIVTPSPPPAGQGAEHTAAVPTPNFQKLDSVIDSLPFEGKYVTGTEGQAMEISEGDAEVLREQLKMQLRNKLWTEWVEEVVNTAARGMQ